MAEPAITLPTSGITLFFCIFLYEVTPAWEQPKKVLKSVLTGKKTVVFLNDQKLGEFKVKIRIYNADDLIDKITKESIVGFALYGDLQRLTNMIVKEYKPFVSGSKYRLHKTASIVLESESLVKNPLVY